MKSGADIMKNWTTCTSFFYILLSVRLGRTADLFATGFRSIGMSTSDENGSFVGANLTGLPLAVKSSVRSIAFDYRTRMLYWAERNEDSTGTITRAKLDGTHQDIIARWVAYYNIIQIALDTMRNKIYWCDPTQGNIISANLDGSNRTTFADGIYFNTSGYCDVSVTKRIGLIFWLEGRFIKSAHFDGSNHTVFVSSMEFIYKIAVNDNESRIYWNSNLETIQSIDLHGNDHQTYQLSRSGQFFSYVYPWDFYLYGPHDKIYVVERFTGPILAFDRRTKITTVIIERMFLSQHDQSDIFISDRPVPVIQDLKQAQVIIEGGEANLDCEVSHSSMNEVLAWYHDGVIVSRADVLLMRNHGYTLDVVEDGSTHHWVITIGHANYARDTGNWTCVFANDISSASTELFIVPCLDCGTLRNTTQILQSISEIILTKEIAVGVSENIAMLLTDNNISAADVILVSDISSRMADLNYTNDEILDSAVTIASNIAKVDMDELLEAEERADAVNRFVQAFERQLKNIEVDDGKSLSITRPNVAVQIQSVTADDISQGLIITLDLSASDTHELTGSNISLHTAMDFDRRDQRNDTAALVNIPKEIYSTVSSSPSTTPIGLDGMDNESDYQQLVFNIYSSPSLYISRSLRNISETNEDFNRSANTLVLSLTIGGRKVEMVNKLINFTFTPLKPGFNPMCSFWDENLTDWSQEGCMLLSTTGTTSHTVPDGDYDVVESSIVTGYSRIVCGCNHLTSFAVLMDIYHTEHAYEHLNRILSYIGCGISIVSLTITIGAFLSNRVFRKKQEAKILICLCLTLLSLYVSFLVMLVLDSTRNYREVSEIPCAMLTALIHFSLLSSIAWMGVEGFNTYLKIIKIFDTYIRKFIEKAALAAWGIPALIVIATGAIARQEYAHHDRCFLEFWSQIGGLLIPVGIILLINTVIFTLVIVQLIRSAKVEGRVRRGARVERRETIMRVRNAVCFIVLLGLTWTAGFFLFIEPISEIAEACFIALNSIQGLLIFLLHCDRMPIFSKIWSTCCRGDMQVRGIVSSQLYLSETSSSFASNRGSAPTSELTSVANIDSVVDDGEGSNASRFRPKQGEDRDGEVPNNAAVTNMKSLQKPQRFSYY